MGIIYLFYLFVIIFYHTTACSKTCHSQIFIIKSTTNLFVQTQSSWKIHSPAQALAPTANTLFQRDSRHGCVCWCKQRKNAYEGVHLCGFYVECCFNKWAGEKSQCYHVNMTSRVISPIIGRFTYFGSNKAFLPKLSFQRPPPPKMHQIKQLNSGPGTCCSNSITSPTAE